MNNGQQNLTNGGRENPAKSWTEIAEADRD